MMSVFKLSAFADEADPAVEGQIKALKENEIPLLEVRGVDGKGVTKLTCDEMKQLRSRLADEGIKIWSIGSPIGKVKLSDDFNAYLDLFRHTLDLAVVSGAEKLRMFSFYPESENVWDDKNEIIDRLGKMMDIARGSGIVMCHENEKGIFGDIPERCLELHKALPELKAVFDPANYVQCGVDTLEAWDMIAPYIDYIHMKDARPDGEVVPPGKGAGNIPQILKNYADLGGGVITLEPHLYKFVGLAGLEREGEKSGIGQSYSSKREAFDAGVNALKALI